MNILIWNSEGVKRRLHAENALQLMAIVTRMQTSVYGFDDEMLILRDNVKWWCEDGNLVMARRTMVNWVNEVRLQTNVFDTFTFIKADE